MTQLWSRLDWTSTVELVHLGVALQRAQTTCEPGRWRRMVQVLKERNLDNARGALWEICALGLFDPANHAARLATSSEPGFDLHVESVGGDRALVSCKSLGSSTHALDFVRRSEATWTALLRSARPGHHAQLLVEEPAGRSRSRLSSERLGRALAALVARPRPRVGGVGHVDVMNARVLVLPWEPRHGPPWTGAASLRLVVGQPMHRHEQRRLHDKLAEVARKFEKERKYGRDVLRAAMIRLPPEIDRASAREYVEAWLGSVDAGRVDGVLLYRAVVTAQGNLVTEPEFVLAHEVDWLTRAGAARSPWHVEVAIGMPATAPLESRLSVTGRSYEIPGAYLFARADETVFVPDGPRVQLTLPRTRPDERVRMAVGESGLICEARARPATRLAVL